MSKALYPDRRVLWMPIGDWKPPSKSAVHCCAAMVKALEFDCDQHIDPFECADSLIVYNEAMDEYGLVIHDGSASYLLIDHCPWCGTGLPESARDRWFDEVDALDLAEAVDPPAKYFSGEWRRRG